jgi:ABC-type nitrate/sulfonate/bicarbonate transport system ATPase subunit
VTGVQTCALPISLDALTRSDLQGWLGTLLQVESRTTVLVTHDIDEALRLADQIIVCSSRPARIVERIVLDDERPRHPLQITGEDCVIVKRRVLTALAAT